MMLCAVLWSLVMIAGLQSKVFMCPGCCVVQLLKSCPTLCKILFFTEDAACYKHEFLIKSV